MSRRLLITAAFAVAAAVAGPGITPGPAAAAGGCDGVWVIVEPGSLGGSPTQRCAPGSPSTGLAALEAAGHSYTFVPRVPGLVCTIDARPDPCNGAPEDAYWSYWHAAEGATSWTYSTKGAGNRTPPPGSAEAWRFGSGDPPSTPPPAVEPEPSPKPTPAPTSPPAGSDSAGSAGGGGSTGDGTGGTAGGSGSGSTPTPDDGTEDRGGTGAPDDDAGAAAGGGPATTSAGDGPATAGPDAPDDATAVGPTAREQEAAPSVRAMEGLDADDQAAEAEAADDDGVAADQPVDGSVRVEPPGGGRGMVGTAVAGTLIAGLAAAGIVRARQRNLEGPEAAAWVDGPDG